MFASDCEPMILGGIINEQIHTWKEDRNDTGFQ